MTDKRQEILELVKTYPDMTVRELAYRSGTDRDTVKDVLVDHLVETGGSRIPQLRRAIDRLASL